jgi:hypothetical protein
MVAVGRTLGTPAGDSPAEASPAPAEPSAPPVMPADPDEIEKAAREDDPAVATSAKDD